MERQLQMLWSQVLGTNTEVGAHDHFFQIGGDSVVAMRIVAAAREVNLRLTVADIFQYPRLSELAIFLHSRAENETVPEPQKVESEPFEMWKEAIGL
jgi:aryl carrier-like protein